MRVTDFSFWLQAIGVWSDQLQRVQRCRNKDNALYACELLVEYTQVLCNSSRLEVQYRYWLATFHALIDVLELGLLSDNLARRLLGLASRTVFRIKALDKKLGGMVVTQEVEKLLNHSRCRIDY